MILYGLVCVSLNTYLDVLLNCPRDDSPVSPRDVAPLSPCVVTVVSPNDSLGIAFTPKIQIINYMFCVQIKNILQKNKK